MFNTIFILVVLFFSIVIHEIAHGGVALHLGDTTAQRAGRLTLNPIKHIDPLGTILLPAFLLLISGGQGPVFGWAKPVPINPYNFKNPKKDQLKVAAAGPAANFLVALFFALLLRFSFLPSGLFAPFSIIVVYNLLWAVFNLMPIPPLDGSKILFSLVPAKFKRFKVALFQYGFYILLFFIFFGGLELVYWLANVLFSLIV